MNDASTSSASKLDTWVNEAVPPGSGRYYALLHDNNATATRAILTLISIWSKLCFSNREIEAARRQLEWWQQELQRSTPLHPVSAALHSTEPAQYHAAIPLLREVLQGYGSLLLDGSPSRAEPAKQFHYRTGAMAALALAGPDTGDAHRSAIEQVGIALSAFRCIRHVHKHTSNGLLCLPFEAMSDAGVSPKDLMPGHYPDTLRTFLQQQLSLQNDAFELFFKHATSDSGFTFLFVYSKLQQRLLQSYQKDLTRLDNTDFRLTPLRNFWCGWRARRQLASL